MPHFHFFGRDFAILKHFLGGTSQKSTLYISGTRPIGAFFTTLKKLFGLLLYQNSIQISGEFEHESYWGSGPVFASCDGGVFSVSSEGGEVFTFTFF